MKFKKKWPIYFIVFILLALLISLAQFLLPNEKNNNDQNLINTLADNRQQYQLASPDNIIDFPQAHWPHKNYRHEWWYLTANLTSKKGKKFATQWTLFRTSVDNKHWYFAHAALADEQKHFAEFREGREELGTVEVINTPFSAVINDWAWLSTESLLPAQLNYGSPLYQLQNDNVDATNSDKSHWRAKLSLATNKDFYLQGDKGFSAKHRSENIASHYYSHPFIDVSGEVYWQGDWHKVSGSAWFDREWGSAMLAEDQQGWDWFSLRLNKQQALMIYRIRSKQQDYIYGNLMNSDGSSETLAISEITLKSGSLGSSDYPQSFVLSIEKMGLDINIKIINDQQVMGFGIEYFEGMVEFTGTHNGEGFVEMTGYH